MWDRLDQFRAFRNGCCSANRRRKTVAYRRFGRRATMKPSRACGLGRRLTLPMGPYPAANNSEPARASPATSFTSRDSLAQAPARRKKATVREANPVHSVARPRLVRHGLASRSPEPAGSSGHASCPPMRNEVVDLRLLNASRPYEHAIPASYTFRSPFTLAR